MMMQSRKRWADRVSAMDFIPSQEKISVFTTNGGTEVQEVKEGSGRIAKPGKMVQK